MKSNRAILDNAGGVTLQVEGFAAWFDDLDIAGATIADYLLWESDPSTWDGHDQDAADLDPTNEQIASGGYKIIYFHDLPTLQGGESRYHHDQATSYMIHTVDGEEVFYAEWPYIDEDDDTKHTGLAYGALLSGEREYIVKESE